MNIKSITIELELEDSDLEKHATVLHFANGMWTASGPTYSRITALQHEVWKLVRNCVKQTT